MLKKRLIGVVTVRESWAVQSFGYQSYLPLGRPETLIENLDRWGADEIILHCIDRSRTKVGPNLDLLKRVGALGISTPLIYGGGIRNAEDATQVINLGADRISVDAILWNFPNELENIARKLGRQAIIANLPIGVKDNGIYWKNYNSKNEVLLNPKTLSPIPLEWVSELMLTDWEHEGIANSFDNRIPLLFATSKKPLILFGGLSEPSQILHSLSSPNVVGVGVGNFLNYKEHSIQKIKEQLTSAPVRIAQYK